ncbi:NAD(P)-dependent alcohol dehydrogenase [Streptomyces sp. NPDC059649]|uniref:NAD(P)-dependent alcohol dehydrogenase n=1 Tax=Streptomyces sp. NPDC059649 TaxID=3346895 RepID=UPI0036944532
MTAIPDTMRAGVLTAVRTIELKERPVPTVRPDEVLVRVAAVGVCGSDVHYYQEGRIGLHIVDQPLVLGHELSGRIVAVGEEVPDARVGERVAVEPQRPCRVCPQCKSGSYNLCPHMEFYGTPPVDGAFCDYVTIPADFAHPVPDSVSDEAAALMEPLSVAIWAARKAGIEPGSRVLITGSGPIGVVTVQTALAFGAAEVIVSDPAPERREWARRFGATTVDPARESLAGLDVDACIDASGAAPAIRSGIEAIRPGGTLVLVGTGVDEITLPLPVLQNRELNVTGVYRYRDTWPTAVHLVASGKVDLDSLVTGRFPLQAAEDALRSGETPESLKSVVQLSQD